MIGVLAPLFAPAKRGGGPIRTLQALVAEAPPAYSVRVLTGDRDLGSAERLPVEVDSWQPRDGSSVYYASARSPLRLLKGFRALRSARPAVLYINGYFDPRFSIVPQLLWRFGFWGRTVRLLAPRGEFGSGALNRRTAKKQAYLLLYRLLRLHKGVYWHASSEMEAETIRAMWGRDAAILIRENETLLPASADAPLPDSEDAVEPPGPLRAAFLGRIVQHKGLHIALEALAEVEAPIRFDIYGPSEDPEYFDRCRRLAERTSAAVEVNFMGSVEPDQTRRVLSGYDVLLMPTAGENFGHVIAEALSVSCPVVCTPQTPWTPTLNSGGGAVLAADADVWTAELSRRAGSSPTDRALERRDAGSAYDRWRSLPRAPHVFELLQQRLAAEASATTA